MEAWTRAVATVEDASRQERIMQNLFLIQTRLWGLLVADPKALYDRDYLSLRDRVRAKIDENRAELDRRVRPWISAELGLPGRVRVGTAPEPGSAVGSRGWSFQCELLYPEQAVD